MNTLKLYNRYSRKQVHDILDPETTFTHNSGVWGMWGIVGIRQKPKDYVFFVTYESIVAGHKFDEYITENGILSWQSQPSQTLTERRIKEFINHNPTKNNIYLFLRTRQGDDYSYIGRLAYIWHNPTKEKPVYFLWKIIDWDKEQFKNNLGVNYVAPFNLENSISLKAFEKELEDKVKEARLNSKAKRQEKLNSSNKFPEKISVTTTQFRRNPFVIAEVLERANGYCEACHKEAPFKKATDGSPFLEVHHEKPLADGGEDTIQNAIALCPNCHRKAHYG